jgi:hypothetical protein
MYIETTNPSCCCSTLVAGCLRDSEISDFKKHLSNAIIDFDESEYADEYYFGSHAFLIFSVEDTPFFSKAKDFLRGAGATESPPQHNSKNGTIVILFTMTVSQVLEAVRVK